MNEMTKSCPVCGAICFGDMDTCFGCLHRFDEAAPLKPVPVPQAQANQAPPLEPITLARAEETVTPPISEHEETIDALEFEEGSIPVPDFGQGQGEKMIIELEEPVVPAEGVRLKAEDGSEFEIVINVRPVVAHATIRGNHARVGV